MSNNINLDGTDFTDLNEAAQWVRNLLKDNGGIYLTETDGTFNIWLINPKSLLALPPDLACVIAETIDRLAVDVMPEAAVAKLMSSRFRGRKTTVPTIVNIQSTLQRQLSQQVDLTSVYHQLETALVYALYDFAESR